LKGPVEVPLVGGPFDGQTRRFEDEAPHTLTESGATYHLDHYMRDYRYQGDAEARTEAEAETTSGTETTAGAPSTEASEPAATQTPRSA